MIQGYVKKSIAISKGSACSDKPLSKYHNLNNIRLNNRYYGEIKLRPVCKYRKFSQYRKDYRETIIYDPQINDDYVAMHRIIAISRRHPCISLSELNLKAIEYFNKRLRGRGIWK